MIACCEVDDIEHYFYSRAILIRYRGEKHVRHHKYSKEKTTKANVKCVTFCIL